MHVLHRLPSAYDVLVGSCSLCAVFCVLFVHPATASSTAHASRRIANPEAQARPEHPLSSICDPMPHIQLGVHFLTLRLILLFAILFTRFCIPTILPESLISRITKPSKSQTDRFPLVPCRRLLLVIFSKTNSQCTTRPPRKSSIEYEFLSSLFSLFS